MLRRARFHSLSRFACPRTRHVALLRHKYQSACTSTPDPDGKAKPPISDHFNAVDPFGHPRIPHRGHYDPEKCDERRKWAELFTGKKLPNLGNWWRKELNDDADVEAPSTSILKGNIENPIGLVDIPVGLVGPALIHGRHSQGYYLCPFATTEGALVASATRGTIACARSGGVRSIASHQRMMRSPVLVTGTISQAHALADWLVRLLPELQAQVADVSSHCRLVDIIPVFVGRSLYPLFYYTTGEAAGQNMVTAVTDRLCKWVMAQIRVERRDIAILRYIVEGNCSGEKKLSSLVALHPRGIHVQAETYIPESVLKNVLKVDVDTLLAAHYLLNQGSVRAGQVTTSMNATNALAAIFTATGQDIACVPESSFVHFSIEPASGDEINKFGLQRLAEGDGIRFEWEPGERGVYVSATLPSVTVGTVGGGTALPTQRECLRMMDCDGERGNFRLAEIIAAVVLGLDLSTESAQATGQFAAAHERLGRNRPDLGLRLHHLDKDFFAKVIGSGCQAIEWKSAPVDSKNSILADIVQNRNIRKAIGIFAYDVKYTEADGTINEKRIVVKSKATDLESCNIINKMAQGCNADFAALYEVHKFDTGFKYVHEREIAALQMDHPYLTTLTPQTHFIWNSPVKDIFVIAMEYIDDSVVTHFNSVDNASIWKVEDIKVILRDVAKFHSIHLGKASELLSRHPCFAGMGTDAMKRLEPLWQALIRQNSVEFPEIWTPERCKLASEITENIDFIFSTLEASPQTLIHNDCNPRNACLRPAGEGSRRSGDGSVYDDPRQSCLYDWELANVDVPQHDVAEFLSFVLPPDASVELRHELVDFHRRHLEIFSGVRLDEESYLHTFKLACCDLAINRLAMYSMIHTYKDYAFLPRVISSHFNYLQNGVGGSDFLR